MTEYTDDDLGLLTEHVDHLQRRVNRLKHFYGGQHNQKTHGRGKSGAGTSKKKPGFLAGRTARRRRTKQVLAGAQKRADKRIAGTKLEKPGFFNRNAGALIGGIGGAAAGPVGSAVGGAGGAIFDKLRKNRRISRNNIRIRALRRASKKKK